MTSKDEFIYFFIILSLLYFFLRCEQIILFIISRMGGVCFFACDNFFGAQINEDRLFNFNRGVNIMLIFLLFTLKDCLDIHIILLFL